MPRPRWQSQFGPPNINSQCGICYLKIYSVLIDLALVSIVAFRIIEHDVDVPHEVIYRLIFLSFLFPLSRISI